MSTQAYPLAWPLGWKRTPSDKRERGAFTGTQEATFKGLLREIDALVLGAKARTHHLTNVVISTNIPIRQDGVPYSNPGRMDDPGVAAYFKRKGKDICIASDKYDQPWKNMKAILKTVEAMRGIERWGASELLDRAFVGFAALPEHSDTPGWRDVLELKGDVNLDTVKFKYRELCKVHHPDKGGDAGAFATITRAYEQAQTELV